MGNFFDRSLQAWETGHCCTFQAAMTDVGETTFPVASQDHLTGTAANTDGLLDKTIAPWVRKLVHNHVLYILKYLSKHPGR